MSRALKPATPGQLENARVALVLLRRARNGLTYAGCSKSLDRLTSTIKSTEGAIRHLERRVSATANARAAMCTRSTS